jgi:hypothetical protein
MQYFSFHGDLLFFQSKGGNNQGAVLWRVDGKAAIRIRDRTYPGPFELYSGTDDWRPGGSADRTFNGLLRISLIKCEAAAQ